MTLFTKAKDGGPESTVTGYWLIEAKNLFSVALLKFEGASREAYHTHAFNSVSWLLKGKLDEEFRDGKGHPIFPSLNPVITTRNTFHRVDSDGTSWVLTFRGPWAKTWKEYLPGSQTFITLGLGRRILEYEPSNN